MSEYIEPEYKKVYDTIRNNKEFTDYLTSIGSLLTTEAYFEKFGDLNNYTEVSIKINTLNRKTLHNIADVIYENKDYIEQHSVRQLVSERFKELEFKIALGFSSYSKLPIKTLKKIFYVYKTSYVDSFFQNNWKNFMPEFDVELIENNEVMNSFLTAVMKEFDKLDNIISNVKNFKKYSEIPFEYINYLTQLLGFEQKTLMIGSEQEVFFRTLAENILDVYSQRGTFATFYLLFYFLGFELNITEYYFDRRYYYALEGNKETNEINNSSYKYYLTKNKPSDNIFTEDAFPITEVVTDADYSEKLQLENFEELVNEYGIDCVLGFSEYYIPKSTKAINGNLVTKGKLTKYDGPVYKYFKTNYVKISPGLVSNHGISKNSDEYKTFTQAQLYTISSLLDFLIPEFWHRGAVLSVVQETTNSEAAGDKITLNGHLSFYTNENNELALEGLRFFDSESIILKNEYEFDRPSEEDMGDEEWREEFLSKYKSKHSNELTEYNEFVNNYLIEIKNGEYFYKISTKIENNIFEQEDVKGVKYTIYYKPKDTDPEAHAQIEKNGYITPEVEADKYVRVNEYGGYQYYSEDGWSNETGKDEVIYFKIILKDNKIVDETGKVIAVPLLIGNSTEIVSALGLPPDTKEFEDQFKVINESEKSKYIMLTDYSYAKEVFKKGEDGNIVKDENGKPIVENLIWYNVVEYVNSVGETAWEPSRRGFPSFAYPNGREIKIINTSRFSGGIIKTNDTKKALYPVWMKDSFRGLPFNNKKAIYIPKENALDVLKTWDATGFIFPEGYEGETLKKNTAFRDLKVGKNMYFIQKTDSNFMVENSNSTLYDKKEITYFRNPFEASEVIENNEITQKKYRMSNFIDGKFVISNYEYFYNPELNLLIEKEYELVKNDKNEEEEKNIRYRKIDFFGRLEKYGNNGYFLHDFDKSYIGFSELDDTDNFILLNTDRAIEFEDLQRYFSEDKINQELKKGDSFSKFLKDWIEKPKHNYFNYGYYDDVTSSYNKEGIEMDKNDVRTFTSEDPHIFTRPTREFTDKLFDRLDVKVSLLKEILNDDEIAEESLI